MSTRTPWNVLDDAINAVANPLVAAGKSPCVLLVRNRIHPGQHVGRNGVNGILLKPITISDAGKWLLVGMATRPLNVGDWIVWDGVDEFHGPLGTPTPIVTKISGNYEPRIIDTRSS